jgi:hypothetical protein
VAAMAVTYEENGKDVGFSVSGRQIRLLVLFFFSNRQELCFFIKKKRNDQFIRKTGRKPIQRYVKGHTQNPHGQFIRKTG